MRNRLIFVVGLLALFVAAQNAQAGTIVMTSANDIVSFTSLNPAATYTGLGSNTITASNFNASVSLAISRSSSSLDYIWSAIPDFPNTQGVGVRVTDTFTLSSPSSFTLIFTGSSGAYISGYLCDATGSVCVDRFGYGGKPGNPPNVGPSPNFTITGTLPAGSYVLNLNGGALPNFGPKSGEVHFYVPEPSLMILLGIGLSGVALAGLRKRK